MGRDQKVGRETFSVGRVIFQTSKKNILQVRILPTKID